MAKIRTPKVFGASGSLAARMTGGKSVSGPANGASPGPFDDGYDPAKSSTGSTGTGWDAPMGSFDDMTPQEVNDAQKRRQFDEAGVGGKAKMIAKGVAKGAVDKVANAPVVSSGPDSGRSLRMPGMNYVRAMSGDPAAQMELAEKAAQRLDSTLGRTWNAAAAGYQHGLNAAWSQEPNKAMLMSGNNLGQSDVLGEWRHKASPPKMPVFKEGKKEQGGEAEEPNTAFGHPSPYTEEEITRRKTDWKLGTPDRRSDPRKSGSRTGKPGNSSVPGTPAPDPVVAAPPSGRTSGAPSGTTRPSGGATGTTRPSGGTGNTPVPAAPPAGRRSGAPSGTTRPSGPTGGTPRPSGGTPDDSPTTPRPGRRSGEAVMRTPGAPRPSGAASGTPRRSGSLPGNDAENPFSVGNLNRRRSGAVVESTSPGRPSGPPTGTTRPSGAPTRSRLRSGSPKPYETPVKRGRKKPGLGTS